MRFELPSPGWNAGCNDGLCFVRRFFRIRLLPCRDHELDGVVKRPDVTVLARQLHRRAFVDLGDTLHFASEQFFHAAPGGKPRVPDTTVAVDVLFIGCRGASVDPAHRLINGADMTRAGIAEGHDGTKAG